MGVRKLNAGRIGEEGEGDGGLERGEVGWR